MEKLSFSELSNRFVNMNKEKGVKTQYSDKTPQYGVVVFKSSNWETNYAIESRSYKFRSDEKRFLPTIGNSIFATNLEETETIRLDWYLGEWDIEYCYIVKGEKKICI